MARFVLFIMLLSCICFSRNKLFSEMEDTQDVSCPDASSTGVGDLSSHTAQDNSGSEESNHQSDSPLTGASGTSSAQGGSGIPRSRPPTGAGRARHGVPRAPRRRESPPPPPPPPEFGDGAAPSMSSERVPVPPPAPAEVSSGDSGRLLSCSAANRQVGVFSFGFILRSAKATYEGIWCWSHLDRKSCRRKCLAFPVDSVRLPVVRVQVRVAPALATIHSW